MTKPILSHQATDLRQGLSAMRKVGMKMASFSGRLRDDSPPLIHRRSAPVRGGNDLRLRLCIDLTSSRGC